MSEFYILINSKESEENRKGKENSIRTSFGGGFLSGVCGRKEDT